MFFVAILPHMNPTPDHPARILIVDDHAIVRYGMGVLLSGADDLSLCGEAENIAQAITAIQELKPDAAVIDIVLKEESGLDLIRKIRSQESEIRGQKSDSSHSPHSTSHNSQSPPLPILVMSMHNESTHAEKALRAGAQGYIMKENADEVLVDALRTILAGKLHVSNEVHEKMLRTYVAGAEESAEPTGIDSLTDREKEIFELIGRGLTTREIADKLGGSPRTVEVHRSKIKKKLECETAAQVVRAAVQWVEGQ